MSKWKIASDFGASVRIVHLLSVKAERQHFDNFKRSVTALQVVVRWNVLEAKPERTRSNGLVKQFYMWISSLRKYFSDVIIELMFIDWFGGVTQDAKNTIGVISSLAENNKQIVLLNLRVGLTRPVRV